MTGAQTLAVRIPTCVATSHQCVLLHCGDTGGVPIHSQAAICSVATLAEFASVASRFLSITDFLGGEGVKLGSRAA